MTNFHDQHVIVRVTRTFNFFQGFAYTKSCFEVQNSSKTLFRSIMSNLRLNRQPRTIIERQRLDKILKDNAKNVGVSKSNGDVISVLERPLRSNFVPFSIDGTSLIRLSDFILVM
jgi:hypothetical protein